MKYLKLFEDFAKDEPELEKIRQFKGSIKDLDDWLRSKIGETKKTIARLKTSLRGKINA